MLDAAVASARVRPRTEYYLAVAPPDDEQVVGFVRLALGGVKAAKLGFTLEGRLRDHVCTNGAWRDSLLFALLRQEHDAR